MNITMKKLVIKSFLASLRLDWMKDNYIILTTSIGLISGKPIFQDATSPKDIPQDETPVSSEDIYNMILDSAMKNFDGEIEGTDGYMLLTDATIRSPNATYNIGTIVVFYDQIIGVSFGNLH